MTQEIDDLREHIRAYLDDHPFIDAVAPKSPRSEKVRLAVYRTKDGKPIGVEFDKKTLQNLWVRADDATQVTLPDTKVTPKKWNGEEWKGDDEGGANHNLKHYDDFPGHDLVRFGVKTKQDAHSVLDHLLPKRPKNRYLLKVNGDMHCPDGICRPTLSEEWEGGEVLIPKSGAVRFANDKFTKAPEIQQGDEVLIWTHEYGGHGDGWGLTAIATVGATRQSDGFIAVQLGDVERILHPFGFLDLDDGPTGSRILDAAKARRDHRAWMLEENEYQEILNLIEKRGARTPEDASEEIENRRLNWRKSRPVQGQFRNALLQEYGERCVLTGCSTLQALEAAHVLPHNGSTIRDQTDNGLLLRRDLHSMFDALLWSIEPASSTVRLAKRLSDKNYEYLDGAPVKHTVSPENLKIHFEQFLKTEKDA